MQHLNITCPHCNHQQDFTLYDVINVSNEPALKNMVMSFELFKETCESCSNIIPVSYQTIYHDFDLKLIVVLDPTLEKSSQDVNELLEKEYGDLEGYQIRLVSNPDELKEKIQLRDAHLDDRVVEIVKQYYVATALERNPELKFMTVLFNRGLTEHEIVFITQDHQNFKAELDTTILEHLKTLYNKKINELTQKGCNIINAQWANLLLETQH